MSKKELPDSQHRQLPEIRVPKTNGAHRVILQERWGGFGRPILVGIGDDLENIDKINFNLDVRVARVGRFFLDVLGPGMSGIVYQECGEKEAERKIGYTRATALNIVIERPFRREIFVRKVRLIRED